MRAVHQTVVSEAPAVGWVRRCWIAGLAVIMCAAPAVCMAEDGEILLAGTGAPSTLTAERTFNIPTQPLVQALEQFSVATGRQVLYDSELAHGRMSVAVSGGFSATGALMQLLSGTGLSVRYTAAKDFVLVEPNKPLPDLASGSSDHAVLGIVRVDAMDILRSYDLIIQRDVRRALDENRRTRSGDYRIGVSLWVDPSGAVERAELFRPTGEDERDNVIHTVLSQLKISRTPPAGMPQPVRLMIMVHAL